MEYKVKIDAFEGPLDLLLHLIKKLEIEIVDIPVAKITQQYLDFIHQMRVLELDVASEYLVMAATLIELKSRMLLPKPNPLFDEFDADMEEEDPREELVRRLLEYRQFKQAAELLKDREQERSLVFTKDPHDLDGYKQRIEEPQIANVSVYDMLSALRRMYARKKTNRPVSTRIQRQTLPIGPRMRDIVLKLSRIREPQPFDSLFPYPNRTHVVVTFLAMLELMKNQQVTCMQNQNFTRIMISLLEGVGPVGYDGKESNS